MTRLNPVQRLPLEPCRRRSAVGCRVVRRCTAFKRCSSEVYLYHFCASQNHQLYQLSLTQVTLSVCHLQSRPNQSVENH